MFFTLFKVSCTSAFVTYGLHKYFVWNHPQKYEDFRFSCVYYSIYYFTKAQMLCMNVYSYIMEMIDPILKSDFFIDQFPDIKEKGETIDLCEFIKEGNIFDFCPYIEVINRSDYPKEFDFIIFSKIDNEDVYNNKIYSYIPTKIDEIIKTNYQFMLTEITIKEETIKIDLATSKHNYYIVDNVIDKHFIIYFLKRFVPYIFEKYEMEVIEDYRLKIIDQDIVLKEMDRYSKLIFYLDNYEIIEDDDYADLPDLIAIDSDDEYTVLSDDILNITEDEYSDISDAIRNSLEDQYTILPEEEKVLLEEEQVLAEEEQVLSEEEQVLAEEEVLLEEEKVLPEEHLTEEEEQVLSEEEKVLPEEHLPEEEVLPEKEKVLPEEHITEEEVLPEEHLPEEEEVLPEKEKVLPEEHITEEEEHVLPEEEEDIDIKLEDEYPDLSNSIPQIVPEHISRVLPDPITSEDDYTKLSELIQNNNDE